MNIEQNEEKSQTQGKFVAVRTEIKDVSRYVMCPTDKKVTMQATLRANQYSGQQISEPRGPSIKIDKIWDCLIKMLKTPGPNDPRAKPKPSKSIFLFVVLIRSSLISAESNQHPAPDNIYWGQHYISWLGGEIVAICTTDMQQCKINHCNGRRK